MIPELLIATVLMTQPQPTDPIDAALDYHHQMHKVVVQQDKAEAKQALEERITDANSLARSTRTPLSTGDLPPLLAYIRSCESGGWSADGTCGADLTKYNYSAYNPSGCEGYGCGGAYQMHARYASVWAARAGYPGLGSNAATWSPKIQDAVALELFYSTNPNGAHWCLWAAYC
jgi:hypothetical protein